MKREMWDARETNNHDDETKKKNRNVEKSRLFEQNKHDRKSRKRERERKIKWNEKKAPKLQQHT